MSGERRKAKQVVSPPPPPGDRRRNLSGRTKDNNNRLHRRVPTNLGIAWLVRVVPDVEEEIVGALNALRPPLTPTFFTPADRADPPTSRRSRSPRLRVSDRCHPRAVALNAGALCTWATQMN